MRSGEGNLTTSAEDEEVTLTERNGRGIFFGEGEGGRIILSQMFKDLKGDRHTICQQSS